MPIALPLPPAGSFSLSDYNYAVRRLLHDPNARAFSDEDINKYINYARQQLARDTGCIRVQQTITIKQGIEQYNLLTDLPFGPVTIDVRQITLNWGGNYYYRLMEWTWPQLNTWLRQYRTTFDRPRAFARPSGGIVYVAPIPNQDYSSDWDTILIPADLVDNTTPDTIPIPFQIAVPYFAAYWAKQYEQSFAEAEMMKKQYQQFARNAMNTWRRSMDRNPYGV
jgi:hypothetical protein